MEIHCSYLFYFFTFCSFSRSQGRVYVADLPQLEYTKAGDLNIGYLISVHDYSIEDFCASDFRSYTRQMYVEAVVHEIERINTRIDILPNITLGYSIFDDCSKDLTSLARVLYLLPEEKIVNGVPTPVWKDKRYKIIGLLGPSSSGRSVMVAPLMSIYKIPLLSSFASSDELSDKSRFEYFLRLVPPDSYQVQAIADLVRHMNWTYVSFLYSSGAYGENAARIIKKKLADRKVCFALLQPISLDAETDEYEDIAKLLVENSNARVVIHILERFNMDGLFAVMNTKYRHWTGHFIWVGGDTFYISKYTPMSFGGIRTVFNLGSVGKEFSNHYMSLTPWNNFQNPWMDGLWEYLFKCSWDLPKNYTTSCKNYESLYDSKRRGVTNWASKEMDGVGVYASALDRLLRTECPEVFRDQTNLEACLKDGILLKYLKETEFNGRSDHIKFDEHGDNLGGSYILQQYNSNKNYNPIGKWSLDSNVLDIYSDSVEWSVYKNYFNVSVPGNATDEGLPESVCSYPCGPKEYAFHLEVECCWECRVCRDNERLAPNNTGCESCPIFYWPDEETATKCEAIQSSYLRWSDGVAVGLCIISTAGICATILISVLFFINRHQKLIKASSRELSAIILTGVFLAFLTVFFFLEKPTALACPVSSSGFNLSVTLIYAPLLAKTSRVYRIFSAGKKGNKPLRGISTSFQVFFTLGCCLFQVAVTTASFIIAPPVAKLRMQVITEKNTELFCNRPLEGLLPPVIFNMALIISCATFGFLTRKLPENFNESWHIFISVTTTSFLWLVFIPTYFTQFYAYNQAILLAMCLVINGAITLLCLYMPKLYAVYLVDEEKIKIVMNTVNTVVPLKVEESKE